MISAAMSLTVHNHVDKDSMLHPIRPSPPSRHSRSREGPLTFERPSAGLCTSIACPRRQRPDQPQLRAVVERYGLPVDDPAHGAHRTWLQSSTDSRPFARSGADIIGGKGSREEGSEDRKTRQR